MINEFVKLKINWDAIEGKQTEEFVEKSYHKIIEILDDLFTTADAKLLVLNLVANYFRNGDGKDSGE